MLLSSQLQFRAFCKTCCLCLCISMQQLVHIVHNIVPPLSAYNHTFMYYHVYALEGWVSSRLKRNVCGEEEFRKLADQES